MAAGLVRVKRQTVGRAITALLKWDTTRPTFTHQFSQLTLQQRAAVLILSIRAVWDAVTAQYGGKAEIIQTLVMSNRTVILRRKSTRYRSGTKLFIGLVGTVELSVTPPTLWDTLIGVSTLVLVHTTGKRLGSCWSFRRTLCSVGDVIQGDVCPHVSTHLHLEGHSERCWV